MVDSNYTIILKNKIILLPKGFQLGIKECSYSVSNCLFVGSDIIDLNRGHWDLRDCHFSGLPYKFLKERWSLIKEAEDKGWELMELNELKKDEDIVLEESHIAYKPW